jgi:hypothetical protein
VPRSWEQNTSEGLSPRMVLLGVAAHPYFITGAAAVNSFSL